MLLRSLKTHLLKPLLRNFPRKIFTAFVILSLLLPDFATFLAAPTFAASSPWTQTDWSGGSGQTSWSDTTKFDSASNVITATAGQATLTNSEKLSNTSLETDLTGWSQTAESAAGTFADSAFANTSGAVAAWPLDETTSTQSYARVVNPAISTGRNLIFNGAFDADASWNKGTGWTISGGAAHSDGTGGAAQLSQTQTLSNSRGYSITFTISNYSAGTIRPFLGGAGVGTQRSANGTYTETIIANTQGGNGLFFIPVGSFTGDIDNVSIVEKNIPAYNSTLTQLLTDGNMEASGTSSWSAAQAAVLSKQTGTPHGGSQVLRVAYNGQATPNAFQNITVTAGSVYRITGYMRSDGTATPRVVRSAVLNTGTTSTTWQPFDVLYAATTSGAADFNFGMSSGGAGQYVEFDDITISLDTYIRAGEVLQDGNMEASGTGSFTSGNSGTLSKETGSPHGGTQTLRVTRNGTNAAFAQTIGAQLIGGRRYRITGWYHGDGTYTADVRDSAGTVVVSASTTSASWQFFDTTFFVGAGGNGLRFVSNATTNGGYAEFDDVSVIEADPLVGLAANGVVLGSTANGHLANAYTFDGTNDFVNIYSAGLNGALNPDEGTLIAWAKVSSGSIWNNTLREIVNLQVDSNNIIAIYKTGTANQVEVDYKAGGTTKSVTDVSLSGTTNWFQLVVSWSKSNDQVKMYVNGSQAGSTQTGLGTWSGNLSSTAAIIGAVNSSGANPWSGMINDVRLYNRPLTSTEVANLYSGVTTTRDTATFHSGAASMKVVTEGYTNADVIQSVNVGDTNTYNLSAYAYTTGAAVTSADAELFYNGSTVSTTYTSVGGGWYRLTGTVTGANAARNYGVQVKAGKTVYLDDFSLNNYAASGTLTSSIFDTGQGSNWGTVTYNATVPTNTSASIKARTSNSSSMLGATAFSSCNTIASNTDISSNNCVTDNQRYIQYQLVLGATDTSVTPTFQDLSIPFTISDADAPNISLTPLAPDPSTDNTPTIAGTATDAAGTVSAVQFQMDSTAGSWNACTADDSTFDEASEAFSCTASTLTDGAHTMYVRATDSNGNTTGGGAESSDAFTIDTVAPTTPGTPSTTSPTSDTTPTWSWTASTDATSGLAATPYTVQWSQSATFSSGNSTSTSPTNSFTHVTPLTAGTWYFRVKAADAAGNESSYSSGGSVQVNTDAPTGSVTINSGANYTSGMNATLTLTAASGFFGGTDNIQMKISNLADLSDASYEPFTATKAWTLAAGDDGTRTVYVQFKDDTNNESGAYTDSILLDTTAPTEFELQSPSPDNYTNAERPTFTWKASSDATSGLAGYTLEVDNPSLGSDQPSGDFAIDGIPTDRTTDYQTSQYIVHYQNFADADPSNNTISVTTQPSLSWESSQNDGKLREGKVSWKVKAVDNAGNQRTISRRLFVDRTAPQSELTQLNDISPNGSNFMTTDKTPTISGKISDALAGSKEPNQQQDANGPQVASGPKQVQIKIEKKNGLQYELVTVATINIDQAQFSCTNQAVTDNTQQNCNKFAVFQFSQKESLVLGSYKITIGAKDNADNGFAETVFTVTISALAEVTTPEESQVITDTVAGLPAEQQQLVKDNIEITKAAEPAPTTTAENLQNGIGTTVAWVSSVFQGVGGGLQLAVRTVWFAFGDVTQVVSNSMTSAIQSGQQTVLALLESTDTALSQFSGSYDFWTSNAQGYGKAVLSAGQAGVHTTITMLSNSLGAARRGLELSTLAFQGGANFAGRTAASGIWAMTSATTFQVRQLSDATGYALLRISYLFIQEPLTISNVVVEVSSPTSAEISWKTNAPANGKVNYGLDETYPLDIQSEEKTTDHHFTLTKLMPDTEYHFEVMSQSKYYVYDANRRFKTPAEKPVEK